MVCAAFCQEEMHLVTTHSASETGRVSQAEFVRGQAWGKAGMSRPFQNPGWRRPLVLGMWNVVTPLFLSEESSDSKSRVCADAAVTRTPSSWLRF